MSLLKQAELILCVQVELREKQSCVICQYYLVHRGFIFCSLGNGIFLVLSSLMISDTARVFRNMLDLKFYVCVTLQRLCVQC